MRSSSKREILSYEPPFDRRESWAELWSAVVRIAIIVGMVIGILSFLLMSILVLVACAFYR